LPGVMHDVSRCRTQRVVDSNAVDRRDSLAYSPARRLGVTQRRAHPWPSAHARPLSQSFDEPPSSWRERQDSRSASATHRSVWPRQAPPAPSASYRDLESIAQLASLTTPGDELTILNPEAIPTNSDRTPTNSNHISTN
jgi:hypothetical protein